MGSVRIHPGVPPVALVRRNFAQPVCRQSCARAPAARLRGGTGPSRLRCEAPAPGLQRGAISRLSRAISKLAPLCCCWCSAAHRELRRRVRDRGAAGAAAMPPAVAAGGLLLAAMAKNSSRCTPRAYALSRREALAPRRGGRMRNDAARDAFRGPEIKLLMPCVT